MTPCKKCNQPHLAGLKCVPDMEAAKERHDKKVNHLTRQLAHVVTMKPLRVHWDGKKWKVQLGERVLELTYEEWLAMRKVQNVLIYTEPL